MGLRLRALLSKNLWRNTLISIATAKAFLSFLGGFWAVVEPISFFSPHLYTTLSGYRWWFLGISVLGTVFVRIPKLSTSSRLSGRDIDIEIRVDDLFNIDGACVISTNTTFVTDIDHGPIASDSLQGQFTLQY